MGSSSRWLRCFNFYKAGGRASRLVPLLALVALVINGCATKPTAPPSERFDLEHWKLTIPDADASEVWPEHLANGYVSEYFYTTPTGAMVFRAPVGGGTTKNSSYPRSELREMINPADDNQNWTADGIHSLNATCQVVKATDREKVIVGQIHGFQARPLVKLQWEKGRINALVKRYVEGDNEDIKYTFKSQPGHQPFSYQITMRDGVLELRVNNETITHDVYATDPRWANVGLYFKAGAYVQDDEGNGSETGEVHFTELVALHQDYSVKTTR